MDWEKIDDVVVKNEAYIFFKKHQKVITMIEGIIVIGLLIGIIMFTLQDREIKEQIRDNCGYVTDKYACICEPNFVANWEDMQKGNYDFLQNITFEE